MDLSPAGVAKKFNAAEKIRRIEVNERHNQNQ
jgi:hypothetical protein